VFFLDKPDENETGKHPDDAFRIKNGVVFIVIHIIGKGNVFDRPEIPVCQFAVEAFVEFLGVERFLPCVVQFDKVGKFMNAFQFIHGQIKKDFNVRAVRTGDGNILNQSDFLRTSFCASRLCRRRSIMESVSVWPCRKIIMTGMGNILFTSLVICASNVREYSGRLSSMVKKR